MRSRGVTARVPAKINLQLSVGPLGGDGFHEVTTVFQAISLFDDAEGELIAAGVDPTIRGEALAISQFLQIGKQLIKHNSTKRVN